MEPSLLSRNDLDGVGITAALSVRDAHTTRGDERMLSTVLIIVLVLALIGALPTWPYSAGWGFYPSGGLGIIVLVVLVLLLTGRL